MDMLTLSQVSKSFGSKTIVKDISFSVPEGSVFGFIGQNGAGKTTTMKMILGLLQMDGGEITVNEKKVRYGQNETNRAKSGGLIYGGGGQMTQLMAFIKKEWMEILRTGKFMIIVILFIIFGVMNPAIAKLTPWLMKMYSKSLEGSGLILTEAKVDALTSWVQFYKNVPMALIVFLLMFSGILAVEYQKGTLINMITKGLSRWKIVISKSVVQLLLWSFGYWMCYGITYAYNEYFWDNSIAKEVGFAAFCVYVLGVWLIALMMLMSVLFSAGSATAVGTGGVFFVLYLLSMLPDVKEYLPTYLMGASGLLSGAGEAGDYTTALVVTAGLTVVQLVVAVLVFNRKDV